MTIGRLRRAGLRTRLTAAFGIGALLLSVTLAGITYELVRSYLVGQRQTSSERETSANAHLVDNGLASGQADVSSVLGSLDTGPGTAALVREAGSWYSTSLALGSQSLPADLQRRADLGQPAIQRFRLAGVPQLAVEIPLASGNAVYFEVFSLAELDHTLRALLTYLAVAAAVTTVAGAAVGRWASGRVLVPLGDIASVAAEIADGRLDTRLEAGTDQDLKALSSSFNRMVDALASRVERDARFASDVSHELRSPLTTLSTSLEVLRTRRNELSAPGQEALDLLGADVVRFQHLVQDLLEISRFDAGAVHPDLEPVRVAELVAHTLEREGIDGSIVHVATSAHDAVAWADKRRLERVLVNLIDNAGRHGGGLAAIGVDRVNGNVQITVDDRGPGVPAELRERVFERFFRGPVAGLRAGSGVGLGLSLVAEQLRLQQGRTWVEERPGGGARFVVELQAEGS